MFTHIHCDVCIDTHVCDESKHNSIHADMCTAAVTERAHHALWTLNVARQLLAEALRIDVAQSGELLGRQRLEAFWLPFSELLLENAQ